MRQNGLWALTACAASAGVCLGQGVTLPRECASWGATTGVNGIMNAAPNAFTYQMIMGASELDPVPLGARVAGIRWRLLADLSQTTWPSEPLRMHSFAVEISTAARRPSNASVVFAENTGSDAVVVLDTPLTIPAGAFSGGASAPGTNPWGFTVEFQRRFVYTGGPLCVTVRQTGHDGGIGNERFFEALTPLHPGWGTRFTALSGPGADATRGNWLYLAVTHLVYTPPPCPADYNGDDMVDFADLLVFLNAYNAGYSQADLNRDGVLDFSDILEFLNLFNTPC
jgi:hypothetical protein